MGPAENHPRIYVYDLNKKKVVKAIDSSEFWYILNIGWIDKSKFYIIGSGMSDQEHLMLYSIDKNKNPEFVLWGRKFSISPNKKTIAYLNGIPGGVPYELRNEFLTDHIQLMHIKDAIKNYKSDPINLGSSGKILNLQFDDGNNKISKEVIGDLFWINGNELACVLFRLKKHYAVLAHISNLNNSHPRVIKLKNEYDQIKKIDLINTNLHIIGLYDQKRDGKHLLTREEVLPVNP